MTRDDAVIINSLEVLVQVHAELVRRMADAENPTDDPIGATLTPESQLVLAAGFDRLAWHLRERNRQLPEQ